MQLAVVQMCSPYTACFWFLHRWEGTLKCPHTECLIWKLPFSLLAAIRWQISQLFILITALPPTAHHFLSFFFLHLNGLLSTPPSHHESFLWLPLQPSPSWATSASNTGRGVNLPAVIKTACFVDPLPSSSFHPWWHNGVKNVWNGPAHGKK